MQHKMSNGKISALTEVPRPTANPLEYDTYEGRLATFYDWPSGVPVKPEDLARAGFYYTHYIDKVKCPYCFGGIYNWEPTDNAFSEHVRHNPKCEFMRYKAYEALSTPVPVMSSSVTKTTTIAKQSPFEEQPSVKAVWALGYSIESIRQVSLNDYGQLTDPALNSDTILNRIFKLEKEVGKCLMNYEGPTERITNTTYIEGAVGGFNLKGESKNGELLPSYDYESLDVDFKNSEENLLECIATKNDKLSNAALNKNSPTPNAANSTLTDVNVVKSTYHRTDKSIIGNVTTSISATEATTSKSTTNGGETGHFDDTEYQRLKAEYKTLKSNAMCSRCRVRGVDCLFLPCRHLVACEACGEKMDHCPQCDAEIIGTVKVFLT